MSGAADEVIRRVDDSIMWIVLNRPASGNAMTAVMRDQMCTWLEAASGDLDIRAVVITAEGDRAFCTGADISAGRTSPHARLEGAPDRVIGDSSRLIRTGWQRLISAVLDCERPVIAGLNGTAAGAGVHLALACDLVMASADAKLVEIFVRRGIAPDAGGAWLLTRLVGLQKAKELFFLGEDVPASTALELGLVNWVVPAGELRQELESLAARLASGPTKAIATAKWLTNHASDVDRSTAFVEEAMSQEMLTMTEDAREGIASFVERRDPQFRGW
jgi:2-(1,2-epoxy-1,2-dihydrophenyl)acetyl-CoA isomerase